MEIKYHCRLVSQQFCCFAFVDWLWWYKYCASERQYDPLHDKPTIWRVRPAKTQISLGIRPVWSESSLCVQLVDKDPIFLHADSQDSDRLCHEKTCLEGLRQKLAGRKAHFVGRGARWLSGRVSDSGARGPGFETYRRRVVSLSKTLYSPKVLVNYPGSDGSVPIWLKNCWLGR